MDTKEEITTLSDEQKNGEEIATPHKELRVHTPHEIVQELDEEIEPCQVARERIDLQTDELCSHLLDIASSAFAGRSLC